MMKIKVFSIVALLVLSVISVNANSIKKESYKVSGKCGMCETRIEKAALSVRGVETAEWDKETGMLAVEYNSDKADKLKIQKAIAKAGHDTEFYTANEKVYEKLPECCKYERAEANSEGCCSSSSSCASAKE